MIIFTAPTDFETKDNSILPGSGIIIWSHNIGFINKKSCLLLFCRDTIVAKLSKRISVSNRCEISHH
jgi:hypothetical protein